MRISSHSSFLLLLLLLALVAITGLRALDVLRGPALVGGSAATEAVLGAVMGAAWGARAITRHRPSLLVRAPTIAQLEAALHG